MKIDRENLFLRFLRNKKWNYFTFALAVKKLRPFSLSLEQLS